MYEVGVARSFHAAHQLEEAPSAGDHHAHDYRVELGHDDESTRALATRAADRLSGAGGRALERGDPRAARA